MDQIDSALPARGLSKGDPSGIAAVRTPERQVDVAVESFADLFAMARFPLAIDSYQRGFVWNAQKIDQLRDDLVAFAQQDGTAAPHYYMGTVLLHENQEKRRFFIIDGQQRLAALCVLHYHLLGKLPPNCEFSFSPESTRNLCSAAIRFASIGEALDPKVFQRIQFTLITVQTVDLAFTLFDTQNNRGVPLHATDLLKAYHLRAIDLDGNARENLQKQAAERWERLQHGRQVLGHGEDFAPALFAKFLWRSRLWTGQNDLRFESHDALVSEFQEHTLPTEQADIVPLYRARGNLLGYNLSLRETGDFHLTPRPIVLGTSPADLPFAIRQPISRGTGFFLFAEKYAALVRELLDGEHTNAELRAFCGFYHAVIAASLSVYLREAFLLATVMYVDQFGPERLLEFALWLDHSIGSVRMEKASIKMQATKNYFAKRRYNLLDVIGGAFTSKEVIDFLKSDTEAEAVYEKELVETGKGVQGRYKAAVLTYFRRDAQTTSLRGRRHWICTPFLEQRKREGTHGG